jgi:hypothetical protein
MISSILEISLIRLPRFVSTTPLRSSMSRRTTPGTSAEAGSTSRGTAISTMKSARSARLSIALAT